MVKSQEGKLGRSFQAVDVTSDVVLSKLDEPNTLYIGGAGDIEIIGKDDTTSTILKAVPAGVQLFDIREIKAAGTTATNVVVIR